LYQERLQLLSISCFSSSGNSFSLLDTEQSDVTEIISCTRLHILYLDSG